MSIPEELRELLIPILSSVVCLDTRTIWNFFFAAKPVCYDTVIECSSKDILQEIVGKLVLDQACQEFVRRDEFIMLKIQGWSFHFRLAQKAVITNFDNLRYDPLTNKLLHLSTRNEIPENDYLAFKGKRCNLLSLNKKNQFSEPGKQALDFYQIHGWRFFFGKHECILGADYCFAKKETTLPAWTVTLNIGFKSSSFDTEKHVSEEDFQRAVSILKALLQ